MAVSAWLGQNMKGSLGNAPARVAWRSLCSVTQEDATIVPTGALFRQGQNWTVYVVKDGRAEIRDIKLLRRSGRLAAVASGLAPGESVIVYPGDRVAPGVRVEVRQAGNSPRAD